MAGRAAGRAHLGRPAARGAAGHRDGGPAGAPAALPRAARQHRPRRGARAGPAHPSLRPAPPRLRVRSCCSAMCAIAVLGALLDGRGAASAARRRASWRGPRAPARPGRARARAQAYNDVIINQARRASVHLAGARAARVSVINLGVLAPPAEPAKTARAARSAGRAGSCVPAGRTRASPGQAGAGWRPCQQGQCGRGPAQWRLHGGTWVKGCARSKSAKAAGA